MATTYDWEKDIAPYLGGLVAVEGGFSPAIRGIVTLNDGARVFVKIATGPMTTKWLKKEIKVYRMLIGAGYPYIPKLLSWSHDETAMAIEYLEGNSFENTWDTDKLDAILAAQESLKQYADLFAGDSDFSLGGSVDHQIKWGLLVDPGNRERLNRKLQRLGVGVSFSAEQVKEYAALHAGWSLQEKDLIHQDLRADNFGYNPDSKDGKLVDWNWLSIGDAGLDSTSLFINMILSGFDPYLYHPEKYDAKTVTYLIGFWATSILNGNEDSDARELKLRTAQAKNIEVCLTLLANRGSNIQQIISSI